MHSEAPRRLQRFPSPELPVIRQGRDGGARWRLTPIRSDSQTAGTKLTAATRRRAGEKGLGQSRAGESPGEALGEARTPRPRPLRQGPARPRPFPGCAPARPARGRKRERGRTPDVKATPPNLAQSQAWKAAGAAAAATAAAETAVAPGAATRRERGATAATR